MTNIGLFGLDFGSGNLGCGALSYSFIDIINNILKNDKKRYKIYIFTQEFFNIEILRETYPNVELVEFHFKKINSIKKLIDIVKRCDYVFDFTAGDSFSDIYGLKRFTKIALTKSIVNRYSQLVLGPQTYGPYESKISKKWAKTIIKNANVVFTRDKISKEVAESISGREVIEVIDVAFALPYTKSKKYNQIDNLKHIGINVSGLLWNGGYTRDNQFSLQTDYKKYMTELVRWLLENGYKVHLLGHVFCEDYPIEDDMTAVKELNALFSNNCETATVFKTPMDAKSYISKLDCLIGARMHATIAALSSECAVIPFAYSRKFNGLYETLNYPYVVDGKNVDTSTALQYTKKYISELNLLTNNVHDSYMLANERIDKFNDVLKQMIKELE